jgi:hypothetical protein
MKTPSLRSVAFLVVLCLLTVGIASANSINFGGGGSGVSLSVNLVAMGKSTPAPKSTVIVNVPFPTAGDAYCSATNGCGTIPAGGQTAFQWTAGDFVTSSIFVLATSSVTDLQANWSYQNFLGGGSSTETWFALVNGVAVASATLPDCGYCGSIGTVTRTVNFAGVAPVAGGYQVQLVLQNTVPFGGGSAAWLDGGMTGLSYNVTAVPEPGSLMLFGSAVLGLAGLLRRKLSL